MVITAGLAVVQFLMYAAIALITYASAQPCGPPVPNTIRLCGSGNLWTPLVALVASSVNLFAIVTLASRRVGRPWVFQLSSGLACLAWLAAILVADVDVAWAIGLALVPGLTVLAAHEWHKAERPATLNG